MKYCISVKFDESKKNYFFQTEDETISLNDFVVVETIVGKEVGQVVSNKQDLEKMTFEKEIKPILRKATKKDLQIFKENKESARKAGEIFEKLTKELNLDMRLVKSEYTLDKEKILFTYFSEERVDFRELLKRLAALLKCRIELRQITARERAALVGGYGVCGLPLCCSYMYSNQEGISLNKAKNQMLTINIPKLSGVCGKLLCCLKYEDDFYTEAKKDFPPINTTFKYNGEEFKVSSYNILTKIVKCVSTENVEFLPLDEVNKYVKQSGKLPQKSSQLNLQIKMPNTLYLVASPIGNLNDVSPRVKEVLSSVSFVACEDTRNTSKLLSLIGISKPCISCHEHNEKEESLKIIKKIQDGEDAAYLSDAGYPCISDPGFLLTQECIKNNIKVVPISGPNAALLALIASGLDTTHFMFYGFLDAKISKKEAEIAGFSSFPYTILLYEAPHRINETLTSLYKVLGNRKICIARELTKYYEEFIRRDLKTLVEENKEYKGELVIVLEGKKEEKNFEINDEILLKAKEFEKLGYSKKDIASILSTFYKINKNKIYKELIKD